MIGDAKQDLREVKERVSRLKAGLHSDRAVLLSELPELFNELLIDLDTPQQIDVTWSELNDLKTNSLLTKGVVYKITDRFNYQLNGAGAVPNQTFLGDDRGFVYLKAIEINTLSKQAVRVMACPITYAQENIGGVEYIGVWNFNMSPNNGEKTIRGGSLWNNLNGLVGSSVNDVLLDSEWTRLSKQTFPQIYTDKQFIVIYDFDNDWFERQWDGSGNIVGTDFNNATVNYSLEYNPCDITDWNFVAGREDNGYFHNNIVTFGTFNNASKYIYNNQCYIGKIADNICTNINNNQTEDIVENVCNTILNNRVSRRIYANQCSNIEYNQSISVAENANGGVINYNIGLGEIFGNSNTGDIKYNTGNPYFSNISGIGNTNTEMSYNTLKNNGTDRYDIDVTGLGAIDTGALCAAGYIEKITLTGASTTINNITNLPATLRKVEFRPKGITVTFSVAGNLLIEGGVAAVINGTSKSDWIEFRKNALASEMTNGANY